MQDIIKLTFKKNKLDETAIFKGKNGDDYVSLIIFPNREGEDQYGNVATVKQDLGAERRDEKTEIIGNAKLLKKKSAAPAPAPRQPSAKSLREEINDADIIPF